MTTPDFPFHLTSSSEPYVVGLSEVILIRVLLESRNYPLAQVSDNGTILPRKLTGVQLKKQKRIARAIKRAQQLALMPKIWKLPQYRHAPPPPPAAAPLSLLLPPPHAGQRTSTRSRRGPVPKPV